MKNLAKSLIVSGFMSAMAVSTVFGQAGGALISVDEFGNGRINGAPVPSAITQDPFSGIFTLTYFLPFAGAPGDVNLFEVAGASTLSDVLRFDGNGHLFFFSELETTDVPPFDPADVAQFPSPIAALPVISLVEVGPEGN